MPLYFRFRDEDNDPVCRDTFPVIVSYLQGRATAAATAATIDAYTPVKRYFRQGMRSERAEDVENQVEWDFWGMLQHTVGQIPYDHSAHDSVIVLLRALENFRTRIGAYSHRLWRELGHLDDMLGDRADLRSLIDDLGGREWPRFVDETTPVIMHEWVNVHSFVARLYVSQLSSIYLAEKIISTMRDTLESPLTTWNCLEETKVMAASQYIQLSVALLFHMMRDGEPTAGEQSCWGSDEFRGREVTSMRRWDAWRSRFQQAYWNVRSPNNPALAGRAFSPDTIMQHMVRAVQVMDAYRANPNNAHAADAVLRRNAAVAAEE